MKTVRYYDLSNISYAGLFLEGFRENERGYGVELQISYDSPPELKELELEKDEQALALGLGSICIFRYEGPGEESLFIVDASDRNWADGDIIEQQEKLLRRCKYYFKINYNSAAISGNEKLAAYAEKIKPISIVYPAAPHRWWR